MLQSSSPYRNSLAMCIFQIGEMSIHLSDDFKEKNGDIPWKQIRGMRNIAAHHYGSFSNKQLWSTVTDDIPVLRSCCEKILKNYELCEQEAIEEPVEESDMEQGQKMF
ncbi:MAG: DUF86 domain-containing protein, partial [Gracilibacteraceae bacterium]|jgi:uncharacterized protein with HEPN domain|nr:DUF86 domain-containing protein [Gracilibacteraceae bacterium]